MFGFLLALATLYGVMYGVTRLRAWTDARHPAKVRVTYHTNDGTPAVVYDQEADEHSR
jgi:hypothetical protein